MFYDKRVTKFFDPLSALYSCNSGSNYFSTNSFKICEDGYGRLIQVKTKTQSDEPLLYSTFYRYIIEETSWFFGENLSYILPKLSRFRASINTNSFQPSLIKLYNIQNALNTYAPDLILELGSGTTTLLFADYASKTKAAHVVFEDDRDWLNNTMTGLQNCGLPCPLLFDLEYEKYSTVKNDTIKKIIEKKLFKPDTGNTYKGAKFNDNRLLNLLKQSQKILVLIDGFQESTILQGAGILMDDDVNNAIKSCVVISDYRKLATQALEIHPDYKLIVNSNTLFSMNNINRSMEVKHLCSSMYSKNAEISILASHLLPFIPNPA